MKRTIIFLCSLFCAATVAAQPEADSLLVRYRQMALDYNDDLKAAAKNLSLIHI